MKKVLLPLGIMLMSVNLNAQIADGSNAPDFTANDIYGNEISLSNILAEGKAVFMDISATWCGPCWSYHNSHELDKMYNVFGGNGSDKLQVLFVEGDNATNIDDLYGTGQHTNGDWVTGVEYPIIDSRAIADAYQIGYFPSFFAICPNGKAYHIHQQTEDGYVAENIKTYIDTNCGIDLKTVDNHAGVMTSETAYYCNPSSASLVASFINYGGNDITTATFDLLEDGTPISSSTFSGSVSTLNKGNVIFDGINYQSGKSYKVKMKTVNGSALFNQEDKFIFAEFPEMTLTQESKSKNVDVIVRTDSYPEEMSWSITNSAGEVLIEKGPYSTSDKNKQFTYSVALSENECYIVNFYDSYGDGWNSSPSAGIKVKDSQGFIFNQRPGNFGKELNIHSAFKTGVLGVENVTADTDYSIFPNPSTGIVNVNAKENFDIAVYDVKGSLVYNQKDHAANASVNLSSLAKGVYVVNIKTVSGKEYTRKLIIK